MARVKVGDRAPDFTLPANTDETFTLSKFFGKKRVVIFFYPMDESPVLSPKRLRPLFHQLGSLLDWKIL